MFQTPQSEDGQITFHHEVLAEMITRGALTAARRQIDLAEIQDRVSATAWLAARQGQYVLYSRTAAGPRVDLLTSQLHLTRLIRLRCFWAAREIRKLPQYSRCVPTLEDGAIDESSEDPGDFACRRELIEYVRRVLRCLPQEERVVAKLRFCRGYSLRAVGIRLSRGIKWVRIRDAHARLELRRLLATVA